MSIGSTEAPTALETKLSMAQKGIQTLLQAGTGYLVNANSMTGAVMLQMIAAWLAAFSAYSAAVSQEKTALAARKAIEPAAKAFLKGLYVLCVYEYGAESETLRQFGFTPSKPKAKLTSQQQVIAKAKAAATRKERGTLGKKQKLAVKSPTPPSVTVTPPTPGKGVASP
jgi:hypothetical protein